ncbi:MAG TPA: hypothetical protein VI485_21310 [Vicinamibacterales bacterium]|nr:hypothetical protein [Vicinamibacterales bacterium]
MFPGDILTRRLHVALACAALLVFTWLAERHAGESVFLEDQVDQLQNFESLLQWRPEGLWGAIMSGTAPPAHALGPLGAVVFGIPVALGLGINSIHVITSLLIAIGTASVFAVLARIDAVFAWLWLLIFSFTGVVWWNAGMLWTNTLLLPIGLTVMALAASCLRRPCLATLAWLVLIGTFGLQLHLVAVVAAPVILVLVFVTGRDARRHPPGRWHLCAIAVVALMAVGPYVMAELMTGFRNTRAIFTHLESPGGRAAVSGTAASEMPLAIAVDPAGLFERLGVRPVLVITIGTALGIAALALLALRARRGGVDRTREARSESVLFWLTVSAVAGIAGQGLFFAWMARSFEGFHHVTLLAPFYPLVPAALVSLAMPRRLPPFTTACALGVVCLALLVWKGPPVGDRFVERTPWSYSRIRAALDAVCGDGAVETDEGHGFAARLNPQYDSVLRYLMKRRLTTCRYQPGSDTLIVAARDGNYRPSHDVGGVEYRLELVMPPGIARYRRWR